MKKTATSIAAFAIVSALAACSGSSIQQSLVPTTTSTSPLSAKLQFAVGTANIAGTVGLNTLVTLRQTASGVAGTSLLSDAPTITGPSGFVVPAASDAYNDAGTGSISAYIPTSLTSPPPQTTFDPNASSGGVAAQGNYLASSYGFFPGVVANSGDQPSLQPGPMPFYSAENSVLAGTPIEYIGGPPAFVPPGHASPQDGTFASGFVGYTLGFADFQATPVSGSYALNVVIPTGINSSGVESYGSLSTTASLTATTVLPAWTTAPSFTTDGTGGGTVTTNFTTPGAATEEYIEVVNTGGSTNGCITEGSYPYYYTFKVTPGVATVTVPDNLGASKLGTAPDPTLCPGDAVTVYGFAVDYPLYSSAFPQSDGNPAPTIVGSAGQDDITTSPASAGTDTEAKQRKQIRRTQVLRTQPLRR